MESATTVHVPGVRVSADGLSAFVTLEPSALPVPDADLAAALDRAGVKSGILRDVLAKLSGGEHPSGAVLIASGKHPSRGEDGRIEWLFSPEPGLSLIHI